MSLSERARPDPSTLATPRTRRGSLIFGIAGLSAIAALRIGEAPSPDRVTADTAMQRQRAIEAAGRLPLDPVRPEDLPAALRSLALPVSDLERLQQAVRAGTVRLVWLGLYDSDVVDGDRVRIDSMGLVHAMQLTARPVWVPLPLPASGRIRITGIDEGRGGGVTVGVAVHGRRFPLPPLKVGQSFELQVAAIQ